MERDASTSARAFATVTSSGEAADPLFILAPPRSFSSIACAMIGQHPKLYGLPETHLLRDETLTEWWARADQALYPMSDGLVRAVAQIYFGEQTESSVRRARGWLRRSASFTSSYVMELLAAKVHPLMLVEKSPSMIYYPDALQRIGVLFPRAKFLHLVRHPRGHGESVMRFVEDVARHGAVPPWLQELAAFPNPFADPDSVSVDPQKGWYTLSMNAYNFLTSVPDAQKLQLRGEDLLSEPDESLRRVCNWLGLEANDSDVEEMKHPQRGPFACYGPPGARLGNDYFFLGDPILRRSRAVQLRLNGPLAWRGDGQGFSKEVKELAREFGYE